jgi:hypothetical protein
MFAQEEAARERATVKMSFGMRRLFMAQGKGDYYTVCAAGML